MNDIFKRSEETREIHQDYENKCMLVQAPDQFYGVPYKIPTMGKNRLK